MFTKGQLIVLVLLSFFTTSYADNSHMSDDESLPAVTFSTELNSELMAVLNAKSSSYQPRTEHLLENGLPRYTNRLILEDSPYLLQHAHNPVNWYPWGDEAFAAAKRENKPIFLSIGYSTCHWCHVMEEESFDNPEIARLMNKRFINIKVDREQRPDIDALYMNAVMMMTGSGGWPMSTFLTPDGDPIHGGTYYPPDQFVKLLDQIDKLWRTEQDQFIAYGKRVASAIRRISDEQGEVREIGDQAIERAVRSTLDIYDELQGGFGPAPKFPNETILLLLLDWAERTADEEVLSATLETLDAMDRGGIHDQVGGGFHRYAIDNDWLVPHFEKMLYNQALLGRTYLKGWQLSGNAQFVRVVRRTLDYVMRDMVSPEGGFYSATDADSEGEEGLFFVWTPEQIREALTPQQEKFAINAFGITDAGNFEGYNILHIPEKLSELAEASGLTLRQLQEQLDEITGRLLMKRETRIPPYRDEKIVTAWNSMMITTLAIAGDLLDDSRYLDAASAAAHFLWIYNRDEQGGLWRTHLQGNSSIDATQEDYAYYAEALLQLYDVTGESVWLERAIAISNSMIDRFRDKESGGFFMSQKNGPGSMGRIKEGADGAIPSGNSVALRVLQQLSVRTGESHYGEMANSLLRAFSSKITTHPGSYSYMLFAANSLLNGEVGHHKYAGRGNVAIHGKVNSVSDDTVSVTVKLSIKSGWHINSHKPLQRELIATSMSVDGDWELQESDYPESIIRKLGFQREQLALYEGDAVLTAKVAKRTSAVVHLPLKLRLQVCSDEICLAPETVLLTIPLLETGW